MSFQPPVLWNLQAGNGYALQFSAPRSFVIALLTNAGECYVQPYLTKPLTPFSTTDATDNIAAGTRTVTPVSMTNIAVGSSLVVDTSAAQETVLVTAVTGTTFTAVFAKAHNGIGTPFPINGVVFPVAPTGSPAPSGGQPATNWWHMKNTGEKRSFGVEPPPTAGTPFFPGGAFDQVYGLLIWAIANGELEVQGH